MRLSFLMPANELKDLLIKRRIATKPSRPLERTKFELDLHFI